MLLARRLLTFVGLAVLGVSLVACGGRTVQRIDTDTQVDLSGNWNDTDSRLVSEEMIADVLTSPWLPRFQSANTDRATVIVGIVKNRTDEFIAVETFTKDMERAFINDGRVRVVASMSEREQIRGERSDQQDFSSAETVKAFGREIGADFMLLGTINKITDQEGGERVVFYQVDLELTDIETNEKVWLGAKKHKKFIEL